MTFRPTGSIRACICAELELTVENAQGNADEQWQAGEDLDLLKQAFADIIEGRVVKRSLHHLGMPGVELTDLFVHVLKEKGYLATPLHEIDVQPGERVPAFYIDGDTAYFGWVFWEKFSDRKMRKLYGSVVRNARGDWAIQISGNRTTPVYVNMKLRGEMDIDNPSGF